MKDIKFTIGSIYRGACSTVCEYQEKLDGGLFVPKARTAGPFQPNWVKTFTTHRG